MPRCKAESIHPGLGKDFTRHRPCFFLPMMTMTMMIQEFCISRNLKRMQPICQSEASPSDISRIRWAAVKHGGELLRIYSQWIPSRFCRMTMKGPEDYRTLRWNGGNGGGWKTPTGFGFVFVFIFGNGMEWPQNFRKGSFSKSQLQASNLIFEARFLLWGVINGEMNLHPHGSSCWRSGNWIWCED